MLDDDVAGGLVLVHDLRGAEAESCPANVSESEGESLKVTTQVEGRLVS